MNASGTIDAVEFHDTVVPGLAEAHRDLLEGVGRPLHPLGLIVEGSSWTYRLVGGSLLVEGGVADDAATVVALSAPAFSDLVNLLRTVPGLLIADELGFERGDFTGLTRWEGALRALYQGVAVYDPAAVDLCDEEGAPLDHTRAFTLDDDDAEMARFFRVTGYLHVRGVFSGREVARWNGEVTRLCAAAAPGDDRSWWATGPDGSEVLTRLVYLSELSPVFGGVEDDPRLGRLVALSGHDLKSAPDRMEGHAVVMKPPGQLVGLANLPWHQDCGLGGHPFICPSVTVGLQLTGSSSETGCLEVIAGSQGKTCDPLLSAAQLAGMPRVAVPTEAGDVTLHVGDIIHASPPPTGEGGRRTMYVTFFPPALFERIGAHQAVNDLVRDRQSEAHRLTEPPPG